MRESILKEGMIVEEGDDLAVKCLDLNGYEEEQMPETEAIDGEMRRRKRDRYLPVAHSMDYSSSKLLLGSRRQRQGGRVLCCISCCCSPIFSWVGCLCEPRCTRFTRSLVEGLLLVDANAPDLILFYGYALHVPQLFIDPAPAHCVTGGAPHLVRSSRPRNHPWEILLSWTGFSLFALHCNGRFIIINSSPDI